MKVQYPRAGDALATDLRQLDRLVPLIRVAAPGLDARGLFDELRARVMAEVDYRQEATAQTAFAEAFRDDPDFLVPAVVDGTDRVLVSEWVDGHPWPRSPAAVTQAAAGPGRRCCWPASCWPAHPGSGDCTATPTPATSGCSSDGRLAVVDFGSSLPMPSGWPPRLEELLRAGRDRDAAALFAVATAAGPGGDGRRHTRGPPRSG